MYTKNVTSNRVGIAHAERRSANRNIYALPFAPILLNQIELHYADGAQPEPKGSSRAPYMRTSD
ncbi:MAG: hypothetical protein RL073_568 [Actinomycetota bacterium]|jgi:hypothetical protein